MPLTLLALLMHRDLMNVPRTLIENKLISHNLHIYQILPVSISVYCDTHHATTKVDF